MANLREAESHVPTLKNQGKSDCAIWIVGIQDVNFGIPRSRLAQLRQSEFWSSPDIDTILASAGSKTNSSDEDHGVYTIQKSRALKAQNILKRPLLPKRSLTSESQQSSPGPRSFINCCPKDANMRRVTSGMWAVRKEAFAGAKQDGGRLLKQVEKQILFSAKCRTGSLRNLSVPEIYSIELKEEDMTTNLAVDMEYIPFADARSIMLERDRATNDWMIESAIDLIDYNLSCSKTTNIQNILPEFQKKAKGIKTALAQSTLVTEDERREVHRLMDRMLDYYQSIGMEVPIGFCHGDLTLANMLIDPENREVCVFDFLDCFVESPMQDIAKLLQDARHLWFLTQITIPEDSRARIVSLLSMFYEKIQQAYSEYAFWEAVPLFEFFCLARILPYMTSQREKDCIIRGLARIYGDMYSLSLTSASPVFGFGSASPRSNPDSLETKVTVIVPALGAAMERPYSSGAPKLLALNSNNGSPIIVNSIRTLKTTQVSRIIIVVLKALVTKRCGSLQNFQRFFDCLEQEKLDKLEFVYADRQSVDACETVVTVIENCNINGPIFIKDADGSFDSDEVFAGNYVHFTSVIKDEQRSSTPTMSPWSHFRPDLVDAMGKSYVSFMYDNLISNISYGSLNSSTFCCGGFSFLSADDFVQTVEQIRRLLSASTLETHAEPNRLKVVDVVWHQVSQGRLFFGIKAQDFQDWGSNAAWLASINSRLFS